MNTKRTLQVVNALILLMMLHEIMDKEDVPAHEWVPAMCVHLFNIMTLRENTNVFARMVSAGGGMAQVGSMYARVVTNTDELSRVYSALAAMSILTSTPAILFNAEKLGHEPKNQPNQ